MIILMIVSVIVLLVTGHFWLGILAACGLWLFARIVVSVHDAKGGM